jgi:hypothetical protein
MNWYEVYHNSNKGTWDIYKVERNGQSYTLCKVLKTEAGARNFGRKHWVKRWVEG